jgi:antitoxin component of MazEF toxin-antitoxin module
MREDKILRERIFPEERSKFMSALNEQVLTLGDPAVLIISQEILKQIGVGAGDKIEIAISDRALVVRPLEEAERARKIAAATRDIFDRRRDAYLELAEGPE